MTLPLLMFIGESLVYFFYLFQNKFYLNHIEENINNNDDSFSSYTVKKFFSKKWIGLILLCSFTELINNIRYNNYFFNYNMKKRLNKIKYPIEFISFFPFF